MNSQFGFAFLTVLRFSLSSTESFRSRLVIVARKEMRILSLLRGVICLVRIHQVIVIVVADV